MKVVFRADASLQIGTGHVMRCLTLADALAARSAICHFICRAHEGNLIEFILRKGHQVHVLPVTPAAEMGLSGANLDMSADDLAHSHWLGTTQEQDAHVCASLLSELQPDWLIVDHYALDARWERALAPHYRKLMVIDDLADRPHACDLLLDQTFQRDPKHYHAWVPACCLVLCGSQYALLRPEFPALRPYSLQRRKQPHFKKLLISMGGVDKDNATGQVLEALRACVLPVDCEITVVMGATAPWLSEIELQAKTMPCPTSVRVGVSNMAQLMADSDLAIGAAGSTAWELCCLGVPSLLICTADNQRTVISALASANATARLDRAALSQSDGISFCAQYVALTENLQAYAIAAARITDGGGASRVCAELA